MWLYITYLHICACMTVHVEIWIDAHMEKYHDVCVYVIYMWLYITYLHICACMTVHVEIWIDAHMEKCHDVCVYVTYMWLYITYLYICTCMSVCMEIWMRMYDSTRGNINRRSYGEIPWRLRLCHIHVTTYHIFAYMHMYVSMYGNMNRRSYGEMSWCLCLCHIHVTIYHICVTYMSISDTCRHICAYMCRIAPRIWAFMSHACYCISHICICAYVWHHTWKYR